MKIYDKKLAYPYFVWMVLFTVVPLFIVVYYAMTDAEGNFTGLDCEINFDTGAYASLCGPVLERACTHAVGPYKYQNTDIRGFGYYTNNPPAGAFRGFGVCQSEFALESLIDLLAEKVGLDPWEIRYKNAIEPGEVLPNGQIADCSTALKETLLEVKDAYYAHPGHAGALAVVGVVVHKEALLGQKPVALAKQLVDGGVGLHQALFSRDHGAVHEAPGRHVVKLVVDSRAGVGQQVDAVTLALELSR